MKCFLPGSSIVATPTNVNNQNSNFTRTFSSVSPLNTYHNSLRKLKNGERMILFRNNSLKRSFKKVNNESPSYFQQHPPPHHCTIELKTKASSCLHLFNKTPPVVLTTFRQSENDDDQEEKNNEILWRYQQNLHEISKTKASHSHCNLNNLRALPAGNSYNANHTIVVAAETKLNNSLENKIL